MHRPALTLTLLTALSLPALADDYSFRHYTSRDGLSCNTVQDIIQDRAGLIWMGTLNGLDSFDGREFIHHSLQSGEGDSVNRLFEDSSGTIWIGTERAAFRYIDNDIHAVPEVSGALVTGFAEDREGAIWISTWGKGIFKYADDGITRFLEDHQVDGLHVARDGRLWAADRSSDQGLSVYNAASGTFSSPRLEFQDCHPARICAIGEDENGDLWLGTWSRGLYRLRIAERIVQPILPPGEGLYHIHTISHVNGQGFMVGSDDGLLLFDPSTGERNLLHNDRSDPTSLSSTFIYAVTRDREGGLWVGTYYGGVNYAPSTTGPFSTISLSDLTDESEDYIASCLCEDPDGTLWIGSDNGGLFHYDPRRKTVSRAQGTLSSLNIHALLREGNHLWIGTYSQTLIRLDIVSGCTKKYEKDDGLDGISIYALHMDGQGVLWAGTEKGICRYDPQADRFVREHNVGDWINDIRSGPDGSLWAATSGTGILQRTPDGTWREWTAAGDGLPSDHVNCLQPAGRGMYAGTKKGLVSITDNGVEILLPHEDIREILPNGNTLWLSGESTLLRYHTRLGRSERFGENDGIRISEFAPNAGLVSSDGMVYLGAAYSIVSFYPGKVHENMVPPPVLITRFHTIDPGSEENIFVEQGTENIVLSWRQRDVRIGFAALSYGAPEKVLYAYRLEGRDNRWNQLGNQNFISLNRLRPGRYRLWVIACNNSGVWNEEGASVSFYVRPHPLLSNVALVIYMLLAGTLLYLLGSWLLRRKERKSLARYEQRLDEAMSVARNEDRDERIRLLSSISEQLDAPLSGIGVQLERLKDTQKATRPAKNEIAVIEKNHRMLRGIATNVRQLRDSLAGKQEEPLEPQDDFLLRLDRLITENLANPDLSVEFLAKGMAVSRSGLFAKTKELCGETPNKLINQARLNAAAKLLSEGNHAVGEICYMTGFSSPSYFSKCFTAQFGITPNEWLRMYRSQQ